MTKPQWLLPAAGVICSLFFVSCALPVVKPTPIIPPYVSAREAVASLSEAQGRIADIRGQVILKTYDKEKKLVNSVSGYLAFKRPDKVRFTYIGPLGLVFFEALINNKTMVLFLPQQLLAYKGSTETAGKAPFSMSLMKAPFLPLEGKIYAVEHDGEHSILYALTGDEKGYSLSEKIIFSRADMRPTVREGYSDGLIAYRVIYKTYEVIDSITVPTEITIEDPTAGTTLEIGLRDAKVNTNISDEAFDVTVGPPYAEQPLEAFVPPEF